MSREDIIAMAREAHRCLVTEDYPGHAGQLDPWTLQLLERFAALVKAKAAAAERPVAEPRKWVGLTDEEIGEAVERAIQGHAGQRAALSWAIRHVSAKLRELNGGQA
jgi:hypothetical protein